MEQTQVLLKRTIQIVAFLFAAFGGFIPEIAPPDGWETRFAVGLSSLITLCVLLLVSGISRATTARAAKAWLVASAALLALTLAFALLYGFGRDRLTFAYPPEVGSVRFIAGTQLTRGAESYRNQYPAKTVSEMVADFGGPEFRERIWETASLRNAKLSLIASYTSFVLTLSATIFCLTEGVHRRRRGKKR